jgi:hypothetical protein
MSQLMEWWRVQVYGSVNSSRGSRIAANAVLGSVMLAAYADCTDFVLSAVVAKLGLCLSAAVSLALLLFVSHGIGSEGGQRVYVPGLFKAYSYDERGNFFKAVPGV